jgi:hypothetical protein
MNANGGLASCRVFDAPQKFQGCEFFFREVIKDYTLIGLQNSSS